MSLERIKFKNNNINIFKLQIILKHQIKNYLQKNVKMYTS